MAKQVINIGTTPGDGTGDPARVAFNKANDNFTELYDGLDAKLDDSQASAFGLDLLNDADAAAGRTTLGLGTLATQSGTFSGTSSGTNTGDQTSIVGITGTKAQFNTALTDGDFAYVGDAPTAHTHSISDVTNLQTALDTKVQIGGQLGNTITSPDVRGIRVADGGGTLLTIGAVADGEFLRRVGTNIVGSSPGAGSTDIKQVEVDFGATPVHEKEFTITDAGVSAGSQITGQVAYTAPTGRDLDEVEMESFDVRCGSGSGSFPMHIRSLEGRVTGLYKINYLIG